MYKQATFYIIRTQSPNLIGFTRRRMLWLHALHFYDYFNECQQVYKTKHRDYACIADLGYTTYV